MRGLVKSLKKLFSNKPNNFNNSTINKRFDPTLIGLDNSFSLIKYSSLKG